MIGLVRIYRVMDKNINIKHMKEEIWGLQWSASKHISRCRVGSALWPKILSYENCKSAEWRSAHDETNYSKIIVESKHKVWIK